MSRSGANYNGVYVPVPSTSDSGLFVSPDGDDTRDGLSPGAARKSLSATAAMLPASGGSVTLLDGTHALDAPLPTISGVTYAAIRDATVDVTSGPLLAATAGSVSGLVCRGLTLHTVAGHLIDLSGSGGLIQSRFEDVTFQLGADAAAAVNLAGSGAFQQNRVIRGFVQRKPTATVPAFNIIDMAGAANGNLFQDITIYGQNGTGAPAIRIEAATQGSYAYDNRLIGIIGEQNTGGLILLLSNYGPYVENCGDWDATVDYAADVVRIDVSATNTLRSKNPVVIASGRRGGTLGAGFYDVALPSSGAAGGVIIDGGSQASPQILGGDVVVTDGTLTLARTFNIGNQSSPNASIKPAYASADGLLLQPGVAGYAGSLLTLREYGDTQNRATIGGDGTIAWGSGSAAPDVNLRRVGSGALATGGKLFVDGGIGVGNSAPATTPGAVIRKIEIFDYATQVSLGFLPIYDSIT